MAYASLAKKYARAFLNLYGHTCVESQYDRFQLAADFFMTHSRYTLVLKLSYISDDIKRQLMGAVIDYYVLPSDTIRLVDLLLDDQRLWLVSDIFVWITDLLYRDNNIERFEVRSSHSLDSAMQDVIRLFLHKATGKHIMMTDRHAPELIAGISVQSNQHKWEYSIKQQIESIENFFSKG